MTAITVDSRARDINFTFQNSCNCFCLRWRIVTEPKENTPIVVEEDGFIHKLKVKDKDQEIMEIKKSVRNLEQRIEELCNSYTLEYSHVLEKVEIELGESLPTSPQEPLTYGYIKRINEILTNIFGA